VRYVARGLANAGTGWRARVVVGSLGAQGGLGYAPEFFRDVPDLVPVAYDRALRSGDPMLASPPLHPSYEDRPGAPDRIFASLDDAAFAHHVREWEAILARPGLLDRVELLHLHHLTPAHEAAARVAPHLPVVTHLHGTELLMLDAIRKSAAWPHAEAWTGRMRRWARRSRVILASTSAAADLAALLLDVPRGRLEILPNGVDLDAFDGRRATPAERPAGWRRWLVDDPRGWAPADVRPGSVSYAPRDLAPLEDPAATVVLFVGRFTAVKRVDLLVRAHARARERLGRPLPLVLWGGAPGEWEGEHPAETAARSPWRAEVFLAGWRGHRELPSALAASDLLAVPSVAEKFGQVYIEAMAMRVPPIACDAEGPPTFIDGGPQSPARAGWLVPPNDERALADALLAAASDPAERALRGENGRSLVVARFGWPSIVRRLGALYDRVAPTLR
jgi:glycosyltransferase involved in cell wall biosynthesis